ncbi:MAG: GH3 auxin-responsive promoter family protein [Oscillospiraceae bacterium]
MKFRDKLKASGKEKIWDEYCGFLDLGIDDYMYIQNRLMTEQMLSWGKSGLGKKLLGGAVPETVEEFRRIMPLTEYEDYADVLLPKKADMLPGEPVVWIQTTWEGGLKPIKLAPYTREMLDVYKHNVVAVTMLASGRRKGDFDVKKGDRVLYGGAPLPYATGLLPSLLNEDVDFVWLPDDDAGSGMSFSQRIKKGFSMAMHGGIDYFFAIGSVANYITENFGKAVKGGGGKRGPVSPAIAMRYIKAKYVCRRDGREITPGDIFKIKGFASAGTDAACYKESLARAWGVSPVEIAAGTESTCIASETWEQQGMAFFPDACFYEFIPESEMLANLQDRSRVPRTCLMNEVHTGEKYELVISVLHGGAFMRYRIGDVYRCVSAEGGKIPRFTFVDRVPTIIDIAGFTRITEVSISEVMKISNLGIHNWLAKKEFDERGRPFLHMYIELDEEAERRGAVSRQVLTEHLSVYFRYFDSDYNDLKKLLGMEPLKITILKLGTIETYCARAGRAVPRISPSDLDVAEILASQMHPSGGEGAFK